MKLELKHLAPYLPYSLKIKTNGRTVVSIISGLQCDLDVIHDYGKTPIQYIKPILRPLSDLTKEFEDGLTYMDKLRDFFGKVELNKASDNNCVHFTLEGWTSFHDIHNFQAKLFAWHFDVFGLIEKGLAADLNTL